MVLFFFGLGFLWLVSPGKRRKIFYGLVMSGGIALVLFLPVLVWNFENYWISFRFQLQHGFSWDGFKPWATFPRYLGGLMLVATPLLGGSPSMHRICDRSSGCGREGRFASHGFTTKTGGASPPC